MSLVSNFWEPLQAQASSSLRSVSTILVSFDTTSDKALLSVNNYTGTFKPERKYSSSSRRVKAASNMTPKATISARVTDQVTLLALYNLKMSEMARRVF